MSDIIRVEPMEEVDAIEGILPINEDLAILVKMDRRTYLWRCRFGIYSKYYGYNMATRSYDGATVTWMDAGHEVKARGSLERGEYTTQLMEKPSCVSFAGKTIELYYV